MIKLIAGTKGTGKTKMMLDHINTVTKTTTGNVVVLEKSMQLTFDIDHAARLVDLDGYNISGYEMLYGFVAGVLAGNYDITHIFIDSLTKIVPTDGYNDVEDFLNWLNNFGEKNGIKFTITISDEPDLAPEGIKQYF